MIPRRKPRRPSRRFILCPAPAIALAMVLALSACDAATAPGHCDGGIWFAQNDQTVGVGETIHLSVYRGARGCPAIAVDASWQSPNSTVASVVRVKRVGATATEGAVLGVAPGRAIILATAGGRNASTFVTVVDD